MKHARPQFWRVVIFVGLLTAACSADQDGTGDKQSLERIEFFMPSELPSAWALGHATQRLERTRGPDGQAIVVSDYTMVWRPEEFVGASRSASTELDAGPSLGLNAGSVYYNKTYAELLGAEPPEAPPLEEAEVEDRGDYLKLTFTLGCCVVVLTSDGIDPDELREIAESLTSMEQDEWREALGNRLFVDDQTT